MSDVRVRISMESDERPRVSIDLDAAVFGTGDAMPHREDVEGAIEAMTRRAVTALYAGDEA